MHSLNSLLITFCIAIGAFLVWHSYGDAARHIIAGSSPWAGRLALRTAPIADSAPGTALAAQAAPSPDQQRLNAISVDLDAMRQTVDRIAITQEQTTRNVDKLTAGVERMTRNVDQLTGGQDRMTREITKLQALEQQVRHKNTESALRPGPAAARKPAPRSAQAPAVR
jgi:septal ring factor EnvC (AmiA/AmiB activator)